MASRKFQNPKGTRDFYPEDMLRRRYVTEAWRAVSLRHGFEEIDGPTFEHLDLYTVKSGEEIISQLFSFTREGGTDRYALRPEFTPTLARMYAARAGELPKPVRWFSVLPYFRAERPQRGRLREFLQWNCDVIGSPLERPEDAHAIQSGIDAEVAGCAAMSLDALGMSPHDSRLHVHDRRSASHWLSSRGVPQELIPATLSLIDKRDKLPLEEFLKLGDSIGLPQEVLMVAHSQGGARTAITPQNLEQLESKPLGSSEGLSIMKPLGRALHQRGLATNDLATTWCIYDSSIVRGLAYYTGTVFEVIAEGERAVAGGGRYDKLIELLGGPPTPAVGFAMGDVVLSNLLQDKGLMPQGAELPEAVEAMVRSQRVRPEVFVVSGGEEDDAHVVPLVARLRRGVEREGADAKPWQTTERYTIRPLHARSTDKATRNLKKLLADAEKQHARFAAIIHGADKVQLKDLDAREDLPDDFSIDPASDRYVGRVVSRRLGASTASA